VSTAPIAAYVDTHVGVASADGTPCAAGGAEVVADGDGGIIRNTYSCANTVGDLVHHSTVLTATDSTARQVVLIGTGENAPQALLDDTHMTVTISAPGAVAVDHDAALSRRRDQTLFLGHDHIAFQIAIVLWARRLWPVIKIVTAFTLAHSVTLSLAALQIAVIPSGHRRAGDRRFEAVENFFSRNIEDRRWVTFAFGLIHGFASALQEFELAYLRAGSCQRSPHSTSAWRSGRWQLSRSSFRR
jgi:hypothetical protein